MNYRKDINGLRAIAVIAVVLFHFNASWVPGGFAGVDVFFVISGFLMTGIIFRGIEQENFSILKFYVARSNRIIPALAVLCFVLFIFGWFYLTPNDYKTLGKHIGGSISFLSNIVYLKESGYFDAASQQKWLLHTWSLSVEWQFYIIYPLLLVAMRSFMSLKAMKIAVLFGSLLGFIFCVIATYKWPNPSFYLLPARAWEMMIGGVAYLYPFPTHEKRKKLLEWFGLVLIISAYFLFTKNDLWPSYLVVLPVLGAFLLIQAQRNDSFIASNTILQKIGDWSYSIYLWHWPFVVAIYYFSLSEVFIYLGILMSVLLGFISHRYIEKQGFRNEFKNLFGYLTCKPVLIVLVIGVIGTLTFITNGFDSHYDKSVAFANDGAININQRRDECLGEYGESSRECEYGSGNVGAIVMGDSHAQSFLPIIANIIPNKTLDWTLSSCRTIEEIFYIKDGYRYDSCGDWISSSIKKTPKDVPIIIHNWLNIIFDNDLPNEFIERSFGQDIETYRDVMASQYIATICKIAENNPVIIIKDTPFFDKNIPNEMAKHILLNEPDYRGALSIDEYRRQNQRTNEIYSKVKTQCNVLLIEPEPILCGEKYCYGDSNGKPLYFDSNHLNNEGVSLFESAIKKSLISIMKRPPYS